MFFAIFLLVAAWELKAPKRKLTVPKTVRWFNNWCNARISTWWDRICGTYRPQPILGHEKMKIGLSHYRNPERLSLGQLLIMPFVGNPGAYSFNRIGAEPEILIRQKRNRGVKDEQDRKEP